MELEESDSLFKNNQKDIIMTENDEDHHRKTNFFWFVGKDI